MATINDFTMGDKVLFGRGRGEQTLGTVVKVNRTKLKVRQDEARGTMKSYPVGSVWTVPPSLCQKVGTGGEVVSLTFKVGQTVTYTDFSWSTGREAPTFGVVTRVDAGAYEVYGNGRTRLLGPDKVERASRRSEAAIVEDCGHVYSALEPERLYCDGERSAGEARVVAARLNRALRALRIEAGREITEDECFQALRRRA